MAPRPIPASMYSEAQELLLQAAYHDDLHRFKVMAQMLAKGKGSLRNSVMAARMGRIPGLEGGGALHVAATNWSMAVCRYLVEKLKVDVDVDVDDVDKKGSTPLICAIHGEHASTIKYLLDHGANQDKANHGDCETLKLLLAKGAYVDPLSTCGTPLHLAATEKQDATMKILLAHNADYNKMVYGMTPIFVAINHASEKCVKLLIEAGVDVKGDYVQTALADAEKNGSIECLFCLLEGVGAIHHEPVSVTPANKRSVTELKSLGSIAFKSKNYHYAAGFYSEAMDLDPHDASLFSKRSLCWLRLGHAGKVLLDAHECSKKRPDWPKAYFRLGTALTSLKDYGSACEVLRDGRKLVPVNAEIENALREAFQSLKTSQSTKPK